jgi:hypothetical protein
LRQNGGNSICLSRKLWWVLFRVIYQVAIFDGRASIPPWSANCEAER